MFVPFIVLDSIAQLQLKHDTIGITAQRTQITPFIVIGGDSLLYYQDQTGGMQHTRQSELLSDATRRLHTKCDMLQQT